MQNVFKRVSLSRHHGLVLLEDEALTCGGEIIVTSMRAGIPHSLNRRWELLETGRNAGSRRSDHRSPTDSHQQTWDCLESICNITSLEYVFCRVGNVCEAVTSPVVCGGVEDHSLVIAPCLINGSTTIRADQQHVFDEMTMFFLEKQPTPDGRHTASRRCFDRQASSSPIVFACVLDP